MTRTLGLIGSGAIGSAIARSAVGAGWHVVVSNSRGPQTLVDLVAELGPLARAATPAEAAEAADLVVSAIPLARYEQLPRAALAGKTVIDTMNYAPAFTGWSRPELDADELTSSELVQRFLAGSHVVKAFHNVNGRLLRELPRPAGAPDRTALPVTGDDPDAKKRVAELLDAIGFDAVDVGALAESWRVGPNTLLYFPAYVGEIPPGLSLPELQAWLATVPLNPVPAAEVARLAATTERQPAGFQL
ncbi:oxidoreductase [Micromonospora rosaria]|uniref:Oxidoreductase n=1 Tax=Micromonospora rosaria TaxID=47874 RepID=A0A136PZ32_9ACTN|nr:NAD(P)-binding domain-containing protein [Micromonospora rosaria]KXK63729.1 oxidoreductase [Micromonospora rosaria]